MEKPRTGKFSGGKISEARLLQGLTQEDLADCIKVTRMTIHNWETGVYFPRADLLMQMADVLGQSTSFFFVPIGDDDAPR